jgi:hypothetical protein
LASGNVTQYGDGDGDSDGDGDGDHESCDDAREKPQLTNACDQFDQPTDDGTMYVKKLRPGEPAHRSGLIQVPLLLLYHLLNLLHPPLLSKDHHFIPRSALSRLAEGCLILRHGPKN